jgi:hypothetical protein
MSRNTSFEYVYRDGDNYKVSGVAVFAGEVDLEMRDTILRNAVDPEPDGYGSFIPGQVGLPDLQDQFHKAEIRMIDAILASTEAVAGPMKNEIPAEEISRYRALREDLAAVKLRWNPETDHPFHEITDIRLTDASPTDPRPVAWFAAQMAAAVWDPAYLPPFHAELLANHEAEMRAARGLDDLDPASA